MPTRWQKSVPIKSVPFINSSAEQGEMILVDRWPVPRVGFFHTKGKRVMGTAVKKTISLPSDLAKDAERIAQSEGKTLSAVIQDALRLARLNRLNKEFQGIQGYWSRLAKKKGILTDKDLERFLNE